MKLAKVLPAMAALVVLSACASDAPKMENKVEQTAAPTVTDKTVVYTCNKKTVTAVYQFENQEPTAAMVMVGNKVVAKDFARDAAQKDFTSFTSGKYVWNVDSGLTLDKFDSVVPVNLLIKGKKADKIVVKNCDVVIVCLEEQLEKSLLVTLNLINLSIKKVISVADTSEHGEILEKIGAEVVYPKRDMAIRLASRLRANMVLDFVQ